MPTARRDRTWEDNYSRLVAYKEYNGDCLVPLRYDRDRVLGKWVSTQRESRNQLKPEREELLDAIGFEWNPRQRRSDNKWNCMFDRLLAYAADNDIRGVLSSGREDPELALWCKNQREYSGRGLLSESRRKRLRDVGFPLKRLQKSVLAKRKQAEHSLCSNLSSASIDSGQGQSAKVAGKGFYVNEEWLATCTTRIRTCSDNQSEQTVAASLPPLQQRRVPAADFRDKVTNDNTSTRVRSWLENYRALIEFKTKFGHCCVPLHYEEDKQLERWVAEQRKRKLLISDERREMLEVAGFSWAASKPFSVLVKDPNEHDPQSVQPNNSNLRQWLVDQRQAIVDGAVSRDCIQELELMGWEKGGFREVGESSEESGYTRPPTLSAINRELDLASGNQRTHEGDRDTNQQQTRAKEWFVTRSTGKIPGLAREVTTGPLRPEERAAVCLLTAPPTPRTPATCAIAIGDSNTVISQPQLSQDNLQSGSPVNAQLLAEIRRADLYLLMVKRCDLHRR